jgi:hypothetical protein
VLAELIERGRPSHLRPACRVRFERERLVDIDRGLPALLGEITVVFTSLSSGILPLKTIRSGATISTNVAFIACSTPSGIRMVTRKAPPGRKSTSHSDVVSGLGVNQRATCSAFVHASNTMCRGASKVREMRSSGLFVGLSGSATISGLRVTARLLSLQFFEVVIEAIEALFPEAAVPLHPCGRFLQAGGLAAARTGLGVAASGDELGALQDLEVLRDGGEAHVEGLGEIHDGALPGGQTSKNRSPRRIGEGGEGGAEVVVRHVLNLADK